MRDSRRAILSQFNTRTWHRAASLRGVQIVHYNEPPQTTPPAITTYANINRWKRFDQFFVWFISFILDRKRFIALSVRQTSSPSPPPNLVFEYMKLKSLLSFLCIIYFLQSLPETLECTLSQTNFLTLPPSPVFKNSLHWQLMLFNDAYSRWSTGNRERATSASEVIEVAGSNHAIGVILNLAWGPNNFSPSMIWSWRTRSNSQTGLGAE